MKYRQMGNTGLKLSEIAIGSWLTTGGSLGQQKSKEILEAAINHGINYIDTADVYSDGEAERVIGEFLADEIIDRKDLVIASKVYFPQSDNPNDKGLSRKHVMEAIEGTLERLNTDYLDIYFCHRFDRHTPLRETVAVMDDIIKSGQSHYWGTSIWTAAQLERVHGIANIMGAHAPSVEQAQYNMLSRFIEMDIMETLERLEMALVPFSPLSQGILTGKYNEGVPEGSRGDKTDWLQWDLTEENLERTRKLAPLADELGISMANMALAWILNHKVITSVITGASKTDHLNENVKAVDIELSEETMDRIDEILDNKSELPGIYHEA